MDEKLIYFWKTNLYIPFYFKSSLIAYMNIIRAVENYSISMVYGLYYYGKGYISNVSFIQFIRFDSLAEDYLNATKSFSLEVAEDYTNCHKIFIFHDELEVRYVGLYILTLNQEVYILWIVFFLLSFDILDTITYTVTTV